MLDDHFVIRKLDAYKTPADAFLNEVFVSMYPTA